MNTHLTIPLFPLPCNVFPGECLPLHIFEERYKTLIADCLSAQQRGEPGEFGILFSHQGAWLEVGCTVAIGTVLKKYADGRLDLLTVGRRRFRIKQPKQEKVYATAEATFFDDEDSDWDEALATETVTLHRRLIRQVVKEEAQDEDYSGKIRLSFYLAASSGMTPTDRQRLLASVSENQRLGRLRDHLASLLPTLEQLEALRASIANGWRLRNVT